MIGEGTIISLEKVNAGFNAPGGPNIILEEISCSAAEGEMVSLIGPNGSGKSTLLKTMIGLLQYYNGTIEVKGESIERITRMQLAKIIGYVAAGSPLPNNMRVEELVALGRFPHTNWIGRLEQSDLLMIRESIDSVGLSHLAGRNLFQLSDGERQRAMIARALAQDTALLVLDEPTAFLDLPNKYELVKLLKKLARERNKAIVLSTHDINIAVRESDRIWILHEGQLSEGAPEDLLLGGDFSNMFGDSEMIFIEEEGTFRYPSIIKYKVSLISDERLLNLTTRALRRYEIEAVVGEADHNIVALFSDNIPSWEYKGPSGRHRFRTIYQLGRFLQNTVFPQR